MVEEDEMKIHEATTDDISTLTDLYQELSQNYSFKPDAIVQTIKYPTAWLRVILDEKGHVVGTGTLNVRSVPSAGQVGYIDDMVAFKRCRGLGLGRMIIEHLIELARKQQCIRVELTGHSGRATAIELYQSVGFIERETGSYVLEF